MMKFPQLALLASLAVIAIVPVAAFPVDDAADEGERQSRQSLRAQSTATSSRREKDVSTSVFRASNNGDNGRSAAAPGQVKKKLILAADKARAVSDQFIVVLDDSTADVKGKADELINNVGGGRKKNIYRRTMKGFSAKMTPAQAEAMSNKPGVKYVEQDQIVEKSAVASWGLDRIDDLGLPMDNIYNSRYGKQGEGATVYVIDTGIKASHEQFVGRVGTGKDFVDDDENPDDCDGHGTHVAGTVAGTTYGVAPKATVAGVRVLNCQGSGYSSDVLAGMDWVATKCSEDATKRCVANMSLGGGYSQTENDAITAMRAAGVVVAVAAGNDDADACSYSPASADDAITVGSTTSSDDRSSFSNHGTCVDIFAPGSSIASAWHTSNTAANTISGTSMASPHVAGVAALIRAEYPSLSTDEVVTKLLQDAQPGKISDVPDDTANLMLYTSGTCGDGKVDAWEECDGGLGVPKDCMEVNQVLTGEITTCAKCSYDRSQCNGCGNGIIESGETCDSNNFGDETCESMSYESGTLACSPNCSTIDTSGCLSLILQETGLERRRRRQSITFEIPINHDTKSIKIAISGGSGDADLYVRYNSPPTTSDYDCRPYANGNNEVCTYNNSSGNAQGIYYIMLYAYTAFSGVDLSFSADGEPVECPGNCDSCDGSTGACTQCSSGYYIYNGSCSSCIANCIMCSDASTCDECAQGFSGDSCTPANGGGCGGLGETCTSNSACCSNKCRGPQGRKTCK